MLTVQEQAELESIVKQLRLLLSTAPVAIAEVKTELLQISARAPQLMAAVLAAKIMPEGTLLQIAVQAAHFGFVEMLVSFDAPIESNAELAVQLTKVQASSGKRTELERIAVLLRSRKEWKIPTTTKIDKSGAPILQTISLNRVMHLFEKLKRVTFPEAAKIQGVMLVCGHSQIGKSTFGNYVALNTHYELSEDPRNLTLSVQPSGGGVEQFKTGGARRSETLLPEACVVTDHNNIVLVDMPGIDETRGVEESIVIAAAIRLLVQELRRQHVKIKGIVFLCDFGSLSAPTFGAYPDIAFRLQCVTKTMTARQRLLLVITRPYAQTTQVESSHVVHNLEALASEYTKATGDQAKLAVKEVTEGLLSNSTNRIVIGDVTHQTARQETIRCIETLPEPAFSEDYDLTALYGDFDQKLLEALTQAVGQYEKLQQRMIEATQAIAENMADGQGKQRELANLEQRALTLQREMDTGFSLQKNAEAQARMQQNIDHLVAAQEKIGYRLTNLELDIRELLAEKERLEADTTEIELPSSLEITATQSVQSKHFAGPMGGPVYYEYSGKGVVCHEIRERYTFPISSWRINRAKHCHFVPGVFPDSWIAKMMGQNNLEAFKGLWSADGVFFTPADADKDKQQQAFTAGKLDGCIIGEQDYSGPISLSLSVFAYQKDMGAVKARITEITAQIAALQQMRVGSKWIPNQLAVCKQALADLQKVPAAYAVTKAEVEAKQAQVLAKQQEITAQINALQQLKSILDAELLNAKSDIEINRTYFTHIAEWARTLELHDSSVGLQKLCAAFPGAIMAPLGNYEFQGAMQTAAHSREAKVHEFVLTPQSRL